MFVNQYLKRMLRILPDEPYLRLIYLVKFHRLLNLKNPQTYNEKLQWLKLYDRNPEYTRMVDKYEAKGFVAERIGEGYTIPTLGVWDHFDEIDFHLLPDSFVLKCTHDSSGPVICRDKSRLDRPAARKRIESCLKKNYYWDYREWPYKDVKPRIIAEPYLRDEQTGELRDYKFYTFGGQVKALLIVSGRESGDVRGDYFDETFKHLNLEWGFAHADTEPGLPKNLDTMIALAQKLSANTPQLRVDFYEANGKVLVGELTFFDGGGVQRMKQQEWEKAFGDWIRLPPKK